MYQDGCSLLTDLIRYALISEKTWMVIFQDGLMEVGSADIKKRVKRIKKQEPSADLLCRGLRALGM